MATYLDKNIPKEEWDVAGFTHWVKSRFTVDLDDSVVDKKSHDDVFEEILEKVKIAYKNKEDSISEGAMRHLEKAIMLEMIDSKWKDHLRNMDELRKGIGLRAYGQRDPLVEYQHEGYDMFMIMIDSIKEEAIEFIFRVQPITEEKEKGVFERSRQELIHREKFAFEAGAGRKEPPRLPESKPVPQHRNAAKIGRNDPCPCGSGKKYKKCCGK